MDISTPEIQDVPLKTALSSLWVMYEEKRAGEKLRTTEFYKFFINVRTWTLHIILNSDFLWDIYVSDGDKQDF